MRLQEQPFYLPGITILIDNRILGSVVMFYLIYRFIVYGTVKVCSIQLTPNNSTLATNVT